VQLLMGLNRQVYFECPEAPTILERLRSILHLPAAQGRSSADRQERRFNPRGGDC
jgi:hypothetical protein